MGTETGKGEYVVSDWNEAGDVYIANTGDACDKALIVCQNPFAPINCQERALTIVAACNAHDELVAALEGLYNHTKNNMNICGINEQARAVLAKIKPQGKESKDAKMDNE